MVSNSEINYFRMAHIINAELGGTGKTTFTSLVYERCKKDLIEIDLIDVDRSNPNVGMKYLPSEYKDGTPIFFSDHPDEYPIADKIYERANKSDILVNLPSQIESIFSNWIERNQLLEGAKEDGIRFVNWYLTNGSYHSLRLFKQFVDKYKDNMTHILVKNGGLCRKWDHLEEDAELVKITDLYGIKSIEIPALDADIMYSLDKYKLSFEQGLKSSKIHLLEKRRIGIFLDKSFEAIKKIMEELKTQLFSDLNSSDNGSVSSSTSKEQEEVKSNNNGEKLTFNSEVVNKILKDKNLGESKDRNENSTKNLNEQSQEETNSQVENSPNRVNQSISNTIPVVVNSEAEVDSSIEDSEPIQNRIEEFRPADF